MTKINSMEKDFTLYTEALALKELGFDEPCFGYFKDEEFQYPNPYEPFKNSEMKSWCITAPLYSQAFRWFREKYGFEIFLQKEVNLLSGKTYSYLIENDVEEIIKRSLSKSGIERAELECLKALIETVKEKQL